MNTGRRQLLNMALPGAVALGAAGMTTAGSAAAKPGPPQQAPVFDVTAFGARGDGRTPSADAIQRAIDAAERAGGGTVTLPPGLFLLEKTPLIASRVHLRGVGPATVLRGLRPPEHRGAALISNKGQQARRYEGAHDWGISHLAIDSPDTNGIVITHAARVYVGFIHGIDVYHHFVDTAGRDILCEHLFLTGRSGTSTFQVDSLSGAQTIWDGGRAVPPRYDDTDTEDLVLRSSIITAVAGHAGHRPRHDCSVHFHGDDARGFLFSDLVLGGATTGFYQDAHTRYDGIQICNVRSLNPGHAAWFNPGRDDQGQLMIRGLVHVPSRVDGRYRGISVHGRHGVQLADLQLVSPEGPGCDYAVDLAGCRAAQVRGLHARAGGGLGVRVRDAGEASEAHVLEGHDPPARAGATLVDGCIFEGFGTGCAYEGETAEVVAGANLFTDVAREYRGPIRVRD